MKTLILDGSAAGDQVAEQLNAVLHAQIEARGWEVERIVLREQKIGNCAGDFFCWIRSPGVCNVKDANRTIAAKAVQSDLLIYLTPMTFGGYSSALKRMVDHLIQNIMPFFTQIDGEVHHKRRYKRYPDLLLVGWQEEPDAVGEAVFRNLAHRNALNLHARTTVCGVVYGSQSVAALEEQTRGWLDAIAGGVSSPVPALPAVVAELPAGAPVQRAVLLVGSPRTKKSTSASLGGYLMEQLAGRGVETQTFQLYTTINSAERSRLLFDALDSADLAVLAFPIYVDSLPGPVIAALEKIKAQRAGRSAALNFAAIANCGFPEASHCANALAVCERFAGQAGLGWAGSLALGAGEGLIHGAPLAELGGMVRPVKQALEIAAESLAAGQAVPRHAADLMARPFFPKWLYTLFAGFGWRQQATSYGAQRQLWQQPYAAADKR